MLLKELGATGVMIPEVGLGTWSYHAGPDVLRRGLEAGARFIDTAESYETEAVVSEAIRGVRPNVFLATKISPEHFRAAELRRAAEGCLRRLRVEQIDLLQLHHPNPSVPIEETMGAMNDLVDEGKLRFIGVSNFSVPELQSAQRASRKHPIVSNQVRYSIVDRTIERELLAYCQANRIVVIAYSPLARGYGRILDCDPAGLLEQIARETGKTGPQVALNWLLSKEGVVVIPRSNSPERVLENVGASDWRLTAEQVARLDAGIQFRQRSKLDAMLRKYTPGFVRDIGLRALQYLPAGLRRKIL